VVRREDWKRLLRESGLISTGTLASFGYALARYGPGKHANTLAFSTLTLAQLLHAFTCRSDRYSVFGRDGLERNPYLDAAIGASVVAQLGTLFVPPLRRLLGATPITLVDAAVITGGALAPLFLNEWMKPGAAGYGPNRPGYGEPTTAPAA
jgi:Ca2+-transporting ATPase